MTIWDGLIWGGTALTVVGLAALCWCIVTAARAKRQNDDEAMRLVMRKVVAVNMAALAASVFGLMFVILGIMLGN
ncbi:hypothetical protein RGQ15_13180 [Paracoccus sp. MBLB3053]|uniref:HIG1 domain-containing protein n=1 Tax=Paracoccus aurantius TaxID=3073814 RepID=A0ABU2HTY6_9RHOB|nr:hypothetical protein [Paracoccus sp. MBLB3053]MDS9468518.1 hypothetical protein [Paracoccus sp. MBLB3053]